MTADLQEVARVMDEPIANSSFYYSCHDFRTISNAGEVRGAQPLMARSRLINETVHGPKQQEFRGPGVWSPRSASGAAARQNRAEPELGDVKPSRRVGLSRAALFPDLARRQGALQADVARSSMGHNPTSFHHAHLHALFRQTGRHAFGRNSLCALRLCRAPSLDFPVQCGD